MSSLFRTSEISSYSLPVAHISIELLLLSELNLGLGLIKYFHCLGRFLNFELFLSVGFGLLGFA